MKKERIVKRSQSGIRKGKTDWTRVRALTDSQMLKAARGDPDTVLLDDAFWRTAVLVKPDPKAVISVRIDRDVLEFFKAEGRGYQTRMNAVLRAYVVHARKQAS